MSVLAPWLDAGQPDATAITLVDGYVWMGPQMRALGRLGTRAVTLRGWRAQQNLDLTISDEQLVAIETHTEAKKILN